MGQESETSSRLRIYVAGASAEIERAEAFIGELQQHAVITHDWTRVMRQRASQAMTDETLRVDLHTDLVEGVDAADCLVLLHPRRGVSTVGAWWECSRALTRGKPILVVNPSDGSRVNEWLRSFARGIYADEAAAIGALMHVRRADDGPPLPEAMTLNEYQIEAARTIGDHDRLGHDMLILGALGLAGEGGEVVELVKKQAFHGKPYDREKFVKELGDVLWYLATLCTANGTTLDHVAKENVRKLRARYPQGFSHEAAAKRADERS